MITGIRTQATNSVAITPYSGGIQSAVGLLTLPTGKSFILTDMVCGFTPSGVMTAGGVTPGVGLLDVAFGQAATAAVAEDFKVIYRVEPQYSMGTAYSSAGSLQTIGGPLVITDLMNGPEFSTCVSAVGVGTLTIPTYGLWVGGIMR